MEEIRGQVKEDKVELVVSGRIDSTNAAAAGEEFDRILEGVTPRPLYIDASELEYISSAGLRVLLGAAHVMEGKGEMVVRNVTEAVREVFDLTGFNNVFKIE